MNRFPLKAFEKIFLAILAVWILFLSNSENFGEGFLPFFQELGKPIFTGAQVQPLNFITVTYPGVKR